MMLRFGKWFIKKHTFKYQGSEVSDYRIGEIIKLDDKELFHTSSRKSFNSFSEAKASVMELPGAVDEGQSD